MDYKVIVREKIYIDGKVATDEELIALDGYYICPAFHVNEGMCTPLLFEYAWPYIEPHIKNMRWDSAEIIEV